MRVLDEEIASWLDAMDQMFKRHLLMRGSMAVVIDDRVKGRKFIGEVGEESWVSLVTLEDLDAVGRQSEEVVDVDAVMVARGK